MSGLVGTAGLFFPLLAAVVALSGAVRAREAWLSALLATLLSCVCFALLVGEFYRAGQAGSVFVLSPVLLNASSWSAAASLKWSFPAAALSLAVCSVALSFLCLAKELLLRSRATTASLGAFLACVLGALGADHPLLFCVFLAGTLMPRLALAGLDSSRARIDVVRESAILQFAAILALLVSVLAFSEPFRAQLSSWFLLQLGSWQLTPETIGFGLFLLSALACTGLFPFHGSHRKVLGSEQIERTIPLSLFPLLGFVLLFRFGPTAFPEQFRSHSPALLVFFSAVTAVSACGFLGTGSARERIFWLQQLSGALVAVGFFTLGPKGWHGAQVLLFFQCLAVPFGLAVLAAHERRPVPGSGMEILRHPYLAAVTAFAPLFLMLFPFSPGFYGALLVLWAVVGAQSWSLFLLLFSVLLTVFAGGRVMALHLGSLRRPQGPGLFTDLSRGEMSAMLPIGAVLLLLGIFPGVYIGPVGASVTGALRAAGFLP